MISTQTLGYSMIFSVGTYAVLEIAEWITPWLQ